MLYIQKVNLTHASFSELVNVYNAIAAADYYSQPENETGLIHTLPLGVLDKSYLETGCVRSGFTIDADAGLICYATSKGNIQGIYNGLADDEYYYFASGRRHGLAASSYQVQSLIPEYNPEDTVVYISQNTSVSPFATDVVPDEENNNSGTILDEEIYLDIENLTEQLEGKTSYELNSYRFKQALKIAVALTVEDLPVDLIDIDTSKIVVVTDDAVEWSPTVTVGGLTIRARQIISDANRVEIVSSNGHKVYITPEDMGNAYISFNYD